jgi:uncharacterized protein YecT (DUF1311 family)
MRQWISIVVLGGVFLLPAPASVQPSGVQAEVAEYLEVELRQSDAKINESYQTLMRQLGEPARSGLRSEQRAWLRNRDQACALDSQEKSRERWFRTILRNPKKTVCVVRFTRARTVQLDDMLAERSGALDPEAQDELANNALYEVFSKRGFDQGKWYFEVFLNGGEIARQAETAVYVAFSSANTRHGALLNFRKRDVGAAPTVVGLAIDLDNGELYHRFDGAWQAAPGSAEGENIKLGQEYRAEVSTSVALDRLIAADLIQVNFGDQAFTYDIPAGYRPVDFSR